MDNMPNTNNKPSGGLLGKMGSLLRGWRELLLHERGNWVQTVPGKGWFTILRLHSPLEPFAASGARTPPSSRSSC